MLAVQSHLLGFIERSKGDQLDEKELKDIVQREAMELIQIEAYYHRTGEKMARQVYVIGMLMGFGLLHVFAALAGLLLWAYGVLDLDWRANTGPFFACYTAGALGAVVSVLSRMTRKSAGFVVDHEIGKRGLHILGSYRPLIGAITGLAVYFLAQTTLLQIEKSTKTFDFFVVPRFSRRLQRALGAGAARRGREDDQRPARQAGR